MKPVTVYNLDKDITKEFWLSPERAVVAAYEQDRGNYNTWDYPKPQDHPKFKLHPKPDNDPLFREYVSCGDWTAFTVIPGHHRVSFDFTLILNVSDTVEGEKFITLIDQTRGKLADYLWEEANPFIQELASQVGGEVAYDFGINPNSSRPTRAEHFQAPLEKPLEIVE